MSPYFATAGDRAYALFLEDTARVVELGFDMDEPRELLSFPDSLTSVTEVVNDRQMRMAGRGPEMATMTLKRFEKSASIAGIYGAGDDLFVLFKSPMDKKRQTSWWLYKLHTSTGEMVARYRVPSKAAHLTVAPGEHWAFIEKNPVVGIGGLQEPHVDINSAVIVPREQFSSLTGKSRIECVRAPHLPETQGIIAKVRDYLGF